MPKSPRVRDRCPQGHTADQVLAMAQADATHAYRDLSQYSTRLALAEDGWHVEYQQRDARLKGGTPQYVIDPVAGAITSKRYEQ